MAWPFLQRTNHLEPGWQCAAVGLQAFSRSTITDFKFEIEP